MLFSHYDALSGDLSQTDQFELVINLKTAKALDLQNIATLSARADKLVE